jgi:hypothetical protein
MSVYKSIIAFMSLHDATTKLDRAHSTHHTPVTIHHPHHKQSCRLYYQQTSFLRQDYSCLNSMMLASALSVASKTSIGSRFKTLYWSLPCVCAQLWDDQFCKRLWDIRKQARDLSGRATWECAALATDQWNHPAPTNDCRGVP